MAVSNDQLTEIHERLGWLAARSASAIGPELFRKELRALGHVEGKNIAFEYRFADDKVDRLPPLLHLKPDVPVTPAFAAAVAVKIARSLSFF